MRQLFVAPALDGPQSGGTLYNRSLLDALGQPARYRHCTLELLEQTIAEFRPERLWVDSLYLDHLQLMAASHDTGLLLHYLPASLTGREPRYDELGATEQGALAACARVLVPSSTFAAWLARLAPNKTVLCVPPGVDAPKLADGHELDRVAMVCNVVENKGVLPFLHALADLTPLDTRYQLTILGSLGSEPAYAQACTQLCASSAALTNRVNFGGAVPHAQVFETLARAALCVSASRMESFGLVLAEARALGVPLLACRGGHTAELVHAAAGGELVDDPAGLARALLRLLREPTTLEQRRALARQQRYQRSWLDAARDFERQCG